MSSKKDKKRKDVNWDVEQILLSERKIFLFDSIESKIAEDIIKKLYYLDKISKNPIVLYINSPGGSLCDGFAIIDTFATIDAPVITYITGEADSMAGLISIAGNLRAMSPHSMWMAHDMSGGMSGDDYTSKVIERASMLEREQERLFNFLSNHTKLTLKDLEKAKNGELWLNAEECVEKKVVDKIISTPANFSTKFNKKKK